MRSESKCMLQHILGGAGVYMFPWLPSLVPARYLQGLTAQLGKPSLECSEQPMPQTPQRGGLIPEAGGEAGWIFCGQGPRR